MPKKDWRSEVRLTGDMDAEDQPEREEERDEDQPFIIAILGDFRATPDDAPPRQSGPIGDRKLLEIDRDNFDEILARFNVHWQGVLEGVPGQASGKIPVQLAFRELDDFTPDRMVRQILPLRLLLETRRALDDPARFNAVAAEVATWGRVSASTAAGAEQSRPAAPPPVDVDASELLDMILGQKEAAVRLKPKDPWSESLQRFLREAVGPHLVRIDTARQAQLTDAVDIALSEQVRSVLHDGKFQMQEAAWRNLYWLVSGAETSASLKVRIVQLTKDELLQDLISSADFEDSGLARLLVAPAEVAGGEAPALMIGLYDFSHDIEDLAVLERMGNIGRRLKAPFVAAASPAMLGVRSYSDMSRPRDLEERFKQSDYKPWHVLRRSPAGRWLALALPRLLTRLPYGAETYRAESFGFEERIGAHDHEKLLWGNPAFAVAAVIAGAFADAGWSLDLTHGVARLEGLPLYFYELDGESVAKPCAEVLFNEQTLEVLEQGGLLPLVSYREQDTVRLPCMQSIAEPRAPLAWNA